MFGVGRGLIVAVVAVLIVVPAPDHTFCAGMSRLTQFWLAMPTCPFSGGQGPPVAYCGVAQEPYTPPRSAAAPA